MDAEDDDEGIIIIGDDDEHGTSDLEGSDTEPHAHEAEEYDSLSESTPGAG
jgi:hypothetical protein